MAVALGSVLLSVERLRRVLGALSFDPNLLAKGLGHRASPERLRRLAELVRAEGVSWEAEFFEDLVSAAGEKERIAVANEHLGDLAGRLGWGARIPIVTTRISILGPLCIAFFSLAITAAVAWKGFLPLLLWGGAGFLGSTWVGRAAERAAKDRREGMDKLVAQVLTAAKGLAPAGQTADPPRSVDPSRGHV
jgi:hypothetical protein